MVFWSDVNLKEIYELCLPLSFKMTDLEQVLPVYWQHNTNKHITIKTDFFAVR